MRSGTKLIKTASRSALARGGEQGRLLDDCKAPETGQACKNGRRGAPIRCWSALSPHRIDVKREAAAPVTAANIQRPASVWRPEHWRKVICCLPGRCSGTAAAFCCSGAGRPSRRPRR